jgi:uncharacterized protein
LDLLILGASTRAAAFSALRAGLRPTCIDLFADADLASTCPTTRIDPADYPEGLARIVADLPPMPWLYTGALENHPGLVDQISARHRLVGNAGENLRAVRDPIALAQAFRDAGLQAPRVQLDPEGLPIDGSWLRKPLESGGGRGILPWFGQRTAHRRSVYFQERVEGIPLAAIFVGDGNQARCRGISRQYLGKGRGGNRFAYRGSLAPWPVSPDVSARIERLGEVVGARFGLSGLFGIDLILKDGHPWSVEVNPRYTASVEVLEWALGRSLLAEHLSVFGLEVDKGSQRVGNRSFAAKAIVYADRECRWASESPIQAIDPDTFPEVADIPRPGTPFRAGEPVLTVFARGESPAACRKALAGRSTEWRRRLLPGSAGSDQGPIG